MLSGWARLLSAPCLGLRCPHRQVLRSHSFSSSAVRGEMNATPWGDGDALHCLACEGRASSKGTALAWSLPGCRRDGDQKSGIRTLVTFRRRFLRKAAFEEKPSPSWPPWLKLLSQHPGPKVLKTRPRLPGIGCPWRAALAMGRG